MSRLSPRRLNTSVEVFIDQRVKGAWRTKRWTECVEGLVILARCGEPCLLRVVRSFDSDNRSRLTLCEEFDERAETDWAIRFLRGYLTADLLYMRPKFARDLESRDELIKEAAADLSATASAPRNPFVDAQLPLWAILLEQVKRADTERVLRDLRGLINEGHPDEYLVRLLIVGELRNAKRPADLLAEVPAARAAIEKRTEEIGLHTVPAGGSYPVSAWKSQLKSAADWGKRKRGRQ
jgi:hypothetical protein